MNCSLHHSREAEYECEKCGAPICEDCYETNTRHWCPNCFKTEVENEIKETESIIKSIKQELRTIYLCLTVGLVISFRLLDSFYRENGIEGLAMGAFWSVIVLGVLGSIFPLAQGFINSLKGSGDDAWWLAILMLILSLAIAPFTTIYGLIVRKKHLRRAKKAYKVDIEVLPLINEYIENASAENAV